MRVIAGQYRSRPIRSLRGMDIRPTADRLRETLFNVLCVGNPGALAGSVWLDLYAGTGAVGIEALSRGAAMVYFVESSHAAAELIALNLKSLGISQGACVMRSEVSKALRRLETEATIADYVFLDPPYGMKEEYKSTLDGLGHAAIIGDTSMVIAEHNRKFDPADRYGTLQRSRKLEQGDAALSFYRRK